MKTAIGHSQRGASLLGIILFLIIFGLIVLFGLRLFPLYYDYYAVKDVLQEVARETRGSNMPAVQVWRKVEKHLEVNSIDYISSDGFKINRNKTGNELVLKYDARTPYLWNIDLVTKFDIRAR